MRLRLKQHPKTRVERVLLPAKFSKPGTGLEEPSPWGVKLAINWLAQKHAGVGVGSKECQGVSWQFHPKLSFLR